MCVSEGMGWGSVFIDWSEPSFRFRRMGVTFPVVIMSAQISYHCFLLPAREGPVYWGQAVGAFIEPSDGWYQCLPGLSMVWPQG